MTVNPAIDAIASRLEPRLASAFLAAIVEIQKGVGVAALARALKSGNLTAALYALATGDIPAKLARAAKVVNEVFALAGVSAMAALPPAAAETLHETGYAIEHRLEAKFGCRVFISEAELQTGAWEMYQRTARRQIVEDVFGEFRPLFYKLHFAIGERDWVATVELLDQLHAQMFSDE